MSERLLDHWYEVLIHIKVELQFEGVSHSGLLGASELVVSERTLKMHWGDPANPRKLTGGLHALGRRGLIDFRGDGKDRYFWVTDAGYATLDQRVAELDPGQLYE